MIEGEAARDWGAAIRQPLAAWYENNKRDLPWRRTRDPYAIWLSEIMLQQTRVDTVIPYYERFMGVFPTVQALAAAETEEVLSLWSGLGYYRRARSLHKAAREVAEVGTLPATRDAWMELPGVGRYTAGAIASIAHGEHAPIVDGNVTRVIARLRCIEDDVGQPAVKRDIWDWAEVLVGEPGDGDPGVVNQALMELGATLCTPTAPECGRCPVAKPCVANARGVAAELPLVSKKKKPKQLSLVAVVAACAAPGRHAGGSRADGGGPVVLLGRRKQDGLFGGLWEPPMVEAADVVAARGELAGCGVSSRAGLRPMGQVRHVLTHRVMNIAVHRGKPRKPWKLPAKGSSNVYDDFAWAQVSRVPVSTLARKVLKTAAVLSVLLLGILSSDVALADDKQKDGKAQTSADEDEDDVVSAADLEVYRKLNRERGAYGRVFVTMGGGKGFRFNNPFRLRDQLGDSPESISATAGYFDMSLNASLGDPDGVQHGGAIHFSAAVEGVGQQAFSLSYLVAHRGRSPVMVYGRLGLSLLTAPDFNAGGELAAGLAYFFTGGLGLTAELVGNLFYGAGTYEAEVTAVPVLSLQGGVIFDFEVLP